MSRPQARPHRHDRALAAGAALGDLAPRELARWTALRDACGVCRNLETECGGALAELALAAPSRVPPPGVIDGIRAAIRAESGPR